jgi:hypothetical protein
MYADAVIMYWLEMQERQSMQSKAGAKQEQSSSKAVVKQ